MNARLYSCRPWPIAPAALVVLSWCDASRPREVIIEWYVILDGEQKDAIGQRFRVSVDSANPDGAEGLATWLQRARGYAEAGVQLRVDEAWVARGLTGVPPLVDLEEVEPAALYGLRLRGGGDAGLRALAELVRDPETRNYASRLLAVEPLTFEDISGS